MNLTSITIGRYVPGDSLLHRLDPRLKLWAVLVLSITIFLPKSLPAYGLQVAFVALLVLLSRVSFRLLWRGLKPVLIFLVISAFFNALFTDGEPLVQLGSFVISREGINFSLLAVYRVVTLVVVASLLTLTTSPIRLTDGMERLLRPLKRFGVPAEEIALMMTIALRFIPTLIDEADRIIKAQAARGADVASRNLGKRIRGMVPILVPLFVSAFRRAEELATAMEARGYRGGAGRTRMKELAYTWRDGMAALVLLLFTGAMIALRLLA
jgi:energy-coupling factor transport system permease protein